MAAAATVNFSRASRRSLVKQRTDIQDAGRVPRPSLIISDGQPHGRIIASKTIRGGEHPRVLMAGPNPHA